MPTGASIKTATGSNQTDVEDEVMPKGRLLARFVLRQSGDGYSGRMPVAAGDYSIEIHKRDEDLEILMFERPVEKNQ